MKFGEWPHHQRIIDDSQRFIKTVRRRKKSKKIERKFSFSRRFECRQSMFDLANSSSIVEWRTEFSNDWWIIESTSSTIEKKIRFKRFAQNKFDRVEKEKTSPRLIFFFIEIFCLVSNGSRMANELQRSVKHRFNCGTSNKTKRLKSFRRVN